MLPDSSITVPQAYIYTLNNPVVLHQYYQSAKLYNWPGTPEQTPLWACWFARVVLADHWPVAEEFIATDPDQQHGYACHVRNLELVGMKGHTTGQHELGRRRQQAPEPKPAPVSRYSGVNRALDMDRIASDVEQFKQEQGQNTDS